MKLRNGTHTNKSLLVYFPEDVWNMILHEYLDINNYWRKCHMIHLRLFKPIHDDYIRKMCRNFSDKCSACFQACPAYYLSDNKWHTKKRIKLITKVYELLITNWNILMMGIVIEEKGSGRADNSASLTRLVRVIERKSMQLRQEVKYEKNLRRDEYISGKYFSRENDKLLDKLIGKINDFEEIYIDI